MPLPMFLQKLSQTFERPGIVRFLARWWIGVGSLIVLFSVAMAFDHYILRTPAFDADTGQPASELQVAGTLLLLGSAGVIGVVVGFARLKRLRG